jgi:hypothetical protein
LRRGDDIRQRVFQFACDVVMLHDVLVTRCPSARDMSRQLMRAATSGDDARRVLGLRIED